MAVVSRPPQQGPRAAGARSVGGSWRLWLACLVLFGVVLPLASTVFGIYGHVQHWGKLVHAVDALCATFVFGILLLAWRDAEAVDLPDELAALMSICAGIFFGVAWEIVEFVFDWLTSSDLQKSNSDTMTDFLWNDFSAVLAAVLAIRAYCHWISPRHRRDLGGFAEWLVDGPSRVLNRHGLLGTIVVAILIGAALVGLWFSDRPLPGVQIP